MSSVICLVLVCVCVRVCLFATFCVFSSICANQIKWMPDTSNSVEGIKDLEG